MREMTIDGEERSPMGMGEEVLGGPSCRGGYLKHIRRCQLPDLNRNRVSLQPNVRNAEDVASFAGTCPGLTNFMSYGLDSTPKILSAD